MRPKRIEHQDGSVAFYPPRWKLLLLAIGALLVVSACVWLAVAGGPKYQGTWLRGLAIATAVVFSVCSGVCTFRLFVAAPILVITSQRVFATSILGLPSTDVPLEWVDHVAICPTRSWTVLALVLREDCAALREGRFPRASLPFGLPPALTVSETLLPAPLSEVAEEVAALCKCPMVDLRVK